MRSFRHFPELGCCYPTPGHISAMLRYGFSFCLCLPDTVQLVTFLAWKKNTPPNSRPRLIHLILALISAISTATHLKNNMFGDKLLRSRAFKLDLLLVLFQSSRFAFRHAGVGFAISAPGVLLRWVGLRGLALSPCSPRPGFPNLRIPPRSC